MRTNRLLIDEKTLLVQLEAAPTGLIRIKRVVFDALIKAMGTELEYEEHGAKRYDFFEMVRKDKRRWGEDYAFSHKWNSIGGKCWARPDITFKHFGQCEFEGNYAEYITANMHEDGTVNEEPVARVA